MKHQHIYEKNNMSTAEFTALFSIFKCKRRQKKTKLNECPDTYICTVFIYMHVSIYRNKNKFVLDDKKAISVKDNYASGCTIL